MRQELKYADLPYGISKGLNIPEDIIVTFQSNGRELEALVLADWELALYSKLVICGWDTEEIVKLFKQEPTPSAMVFVDRGIASPIRLCNVQTETISGILIAHCRFKYLDEGVE